jgi:hypothetical protein
VSQFSLDQNGMPILLADVPNANVSRIDPNAKSGNPRHDARSGKFGPGGGGKKRPQPPANVNPVDYYRMLDAVREAARRFDGEITEENLQSFIEERANNPEAVNIQQFAALVGQQRIADLVDIIDGSTPGGKRTIKVSAPRSYVKKVLAGLTDDDVAEIVHRLEQRGNDPEIMDKWIIGKRLPKERQDAVREKKSKLTASEWKPDPLYDLELAEAFDEFEREHLGYDPLQLAEAIRNMPQPVIEVKPEIVVKMPQQKPLRREIIRDEKGLAVGYRDIPES